MKLILDYKITTILLAGSILRIISILLIQVILSLILLKKFKPNS